MRSIPGPALAPATAARRELFVEDHPVVGLLDRPGRRFARLRRERLERYYGTTLPGVAVWRARARFVGGVGEHGRAPVLGARRRRPTGGSGAIGEAVPPPR